MMNLHWPMIKIFRPKHKKLGILRIILKVGKPAERQTCVKTWDICFKKFKMRKGNHLGLQVHKRVGPMCRFSNMMEEIILKLNSRRKRMIHKVDSCIKECTKLYHKLHSIILYSGLIIAKVIEMTTSFSLINWD